MWFSAFFVCSACLRRLTRRERCPCGNRQLLSLLSEPGRAFYRKAAGRATPRFEGLQRRFAWLSRYDPTALLVSAIVFCAPLLYTLLTGGLRAVGDLSIIYGILLLCGLAILALGLVARLSNARTTERLRLYSLGHQPTGTTTLRGIARRATTEIVSGISGTPCLLFGVRGEIGNVELDDADGGDFDLELPSGERVAVSLEHAILAPGGAEPIQELGQRLDPVLVQLLEQRGISHEGQRVRLTETVIQEGDEVVVEGELLDGGLVATGYRGAKVVRVLGGVEGTPLRIRAMLRPSDGREDESFEPSENRSGLGQGVLKE